MLAEAVAMIEGPIGGPVHVVGHSDGASLGLMLATRRPELVSSVAAFSGNLDPSGMAPSTLSRAELAEALVEAVAPDYAAVSPDGVGHLAVVVDKAVALWYSEPSLTPDDLMRITCPVLVACGERDSIERAHTLSIHAAIAGARLAVVAGTGHLQVAEAPEACAALVAELVAGSR